MKAYGLLAVVMLVGNAMPVQGDPQTLGDTNPLADAALAVAAGALVGSVLDECPAEAEADCTGPVCILDALANPLPGEPLDGQIMICIAGGLVCAAFSEDMSDFNFGFLPSGTGVFVSGILATPFQSELGRGGIPHPREIIAPWNPVFGTLVLEIDPWARGCE